MNRLFLILALLLPVVCLSADEKTESIHALNGLVDIAMMLIITFLPLISVLSICLAAAANLIKRYENSNTCVFIAFLAILFYGTLELFTQYHLKNLSVNMRLFIMSYIVIVGLVIFAINLFKAKRAREEMTISITDKGMVQ